MDNSSIKVQIRIGRGLYNELQRLARMRYGGNKTAVIKAGIRMAIDQEAERQRMALGEVKSEK